MKTRKFAWKNKDAGPVDSTLHSGEDSIMGLLQLHWKQSLVDNSNIGIWTDQEYESCPASH